MMRKPLQIVGLDPTTLKQFYSASYFFACKTFCNNSKTIMTLPQVIFIFH